MQGSQFRWRKFCSGMTDIQFHRGPDAEGQKILSSGDTQVALGHRRLSIIDLAGGSQPMANEDGTVWIAYNGEIYNHLALRSELESQGHRYKTHSDTETIIHAYEQWGPQCVNRLRGMFAFVIWDSRRHRLFAARDRMGIKPFYYAVQGKTFLCASEIKGILASQLQEAKLKRASLPELMTFGYLAGAETLFEGVKTLLPGHWLIWEDGQIRTESYWDVPLPAEEGHSSSEEEFTRQFRELFEGIGADAFDERCAARNFSQWRAGFECHRGDHGKANGRPVDDFFSRLRVKIL